MNGEQLNGRERHFQGEIEKLRKERSNRQKKWETVQVKLKEAEALKLEGKLKLHIASGEHDAGKDTHAKETGRAIEVDIEREYGNLMKLADPDNGSSDWDECLKKLRQLTGEPETDAEPELEPETAN